MFAADQASQALGIELVETGEGGAVLRMKVTDVMVNGHGIAHGGYIFLLADSAFACARNSRGPVTGAAGAGISFIAPVRPRDEPTAVAEEPVPLWRRGVQRVSGTRGAESS